MERSHSRPSKILVDTQSKTLKQYIEEKIDMITDEFRIYLREEEKAHFRSLKSEIEVDHYARDILLR